jgi:hypothetical protein
MSVPTLLDDDLPAKAEGVTGSDFAIHAMLVWLVHMYRAVRLAAK